MDQFCCFTEWSKRKAGLLTRQKLHRSQLDLKEHVDWVVGSEWALGKGSEFTLRERQPVQTQGRGGWVSLLTLCPLFPSGNTSAKLLPQCRSSTQECLPQEGSSTKKCQALVISEHFHALGWRLWVGVRMMLPISEGPQHQIVSCQSTNRTSKVPCTMAALCPARDLGEPL